MSDGLPVAALAPDRREGKGCARVGGRGPGIWSAVREHRFDGMPADCGMQRVSAAATITRAAGRVRDDPPS